MHNPMSYNYLCMILFGIIILKYSSFVKPKMDMQMVNAFQNTHLMLNVIFRNLSLNTEHIIISLNI